MSCGLDEDATATKHFNKGRYQPSHVVAVQEAPLMQDPDTFLGEDIQVGLS